MKKLNIILFLLLCKLSIIAQDNSKHFISLSYISSLNFNNSIRNAKSTNPVYLKGHTTLGQGVSFFYSKEIGKKRNYSFQIGTEYNTHSKKFSVNYPLQKFDTGYSASQFYKKDFEIKGYKNFDIIVGIMRNIKFSERFSISPSINLMFDWNAFYSKDISFIEYYNHADNSLISSNILIVDGTQGITRRRRGFLEYLELVTPKYNVGCQLSYKIGKISLISNFSYEKMFTFNNNQSGLHSIDVRLYSVSGANNQKNVYANYYENIKIKLGVKIPLDFKKNRY